MKIITKNKRVFFDYTIKEKLEAGIVLFGHEVKSIKEGNISLKGSFVTINRGEAWLLNAHVPIYRNAVAKNYDPRRTRKLLLHQKEIQRLSSVIEGKGITLLPLEVYLQKGKIKIQIGVGLGKKQYDKRETIRKREDERKIKRALRKK